VEGVDVQDSRTYEDYAALNELIVGGDESPAVLLELGYLFELQEQKRIIPCRQDLPAHAMFTGMIDDGVVVLVLSYCWCTPEHPDPDGKLLADVCKFGRYLEELRAFVGPTHLGLRGRRVVVFWDYPSLYQNRPGDPLTKWQQRSFQTGMGLANILYAHTKTWVLLCTHAYRALTYSESAWPFFEWSVSHLIKDPDLIVDLPTALHFIKQTATDAETWKRSLYFLRDTCRRRARRLALAPEAFNSALANKPIANSEDRLALRRMYRQAFVTVVRPTMSFQLCDLPSIDTLSWRAFLTDTLHHCGYLRQLDLSCNESISCGLDPFAVLRVLEVLRISLCRGFRGTLQPLSDLTKLRELEAAGCSGLTGGLGPLAALEELRCLDIQGCTGLCGNVEPLESLPALQALDVRGTMLQGWAHLTEQRTSMASGGRPEEKPAAWLLCRAAYYCMVGTAELLLQRRAAVDMARADGFTPLLLAAEKGHGEVVKMLFQHSACADTAESTGATPLFMAAQNGHLRVAHLLFEHGATVDLADDDGATPLLMAAQQGNGSMVELLLLKGASTDLAENTGRTPLFMAVAEGHIRAAQVLLAHNASPDLARDNGATPLLVAALQGRCDMVVLLLHKGATPNQADHDGYTPLSAAADGGQGEVVHLLLGHSAEVDPVDSSGCTPLFWAAANGHGDVLKLLLRHGAGADRADALRGTPLQVAAANGHGKAVGLLLDQGACVDQVYADGTTPLHKAVKGDHREVVELLLEYSAAVHHTNQTQATPLHVAAGLGHSETARLLLQRGAGVNRADGEGATPLYMAAGNGHGQAVALLLEHRAASGQPNNGGCTPLLTAAQGGHLEIVGLLLDAGAADAGFAGLVDLMLEEHTEDEPVEFTEAVAQIEQEAAEAPVVVHLGGVRLGRKHDHRLFALHFGRGLTTVGVPGALTFSGVLYYEVSILVSLGVPLFGFATRGFEAEGGSPVLGSDDVSWAVNGFQQVLSHGGRSRPWSCEWKVGDVIGLAANVDAGKIALCKGEWSDPRHGVVFESERIKAGVFPCITASLYAVRYNFDGDMHGAYVHGPPPPCVWSSFVF